MGNVIQINKISWWHESIVDWQLANPEKLLGDCAEAFNVTQSYLSVIINSDIFKEYRAQRRTLHNQAVSEGIVSKVQEVAEISLDILAERLETERDEIKISTVANTANMALKALGFGSKGGQETSNVNVNLNLSCSSESLANAREKMKMLNVIEEKKEITDAHQGTGEISPS